MDRPPTRTRTSQRANPRLWLAWSFLSAYLIAGILVDRSNFWEDSNRLFVLGVPLVILAILRISAKLFLAAGAIHCGITLWIAFRAWAGPLELQGLMTNFLATVALVELAGHHRRKARATTTTPEES